MDVIMNEFLEEPERFADFFNGVVFGGEEVIKPEELKCVSGRYKVSSSGEKGRGRKTKSSNRYRDIKMEWKDSAGLRILAIENQNRIDYSMPFRIMGYDSAEYDKQIRAHKKRYREEGTRLIPGGLKKDDKLAPVYTIVFYHGTEKYADWPKEISDMIDFPKGDRMRKLFSDYGIHLICVDDMENGDIFHTDLKLLIKAMSYRDNKTELREHLMTDRDYEHVGEDVLEAISAAVNSPAIWEKRREYISTRNEMEGYDMCKAMDEWEADVRAEGRAEGREEGREQSRIDSIRSIMKNLKLSLQEAMDALSIPLEEQQKYKMKLQ